jgi:hypothetical protein
MQRYSILFLTLFLASCSWADEAADRVAIDRAVASLNQLPRSASIFTEDASSELGRLPNVDPLTIRVPGPQSYPVPTGEATLTISREPWGEVAIAYPGVPHSRVFEIINPRIENNGPIRFLTPDVALTDGVWTHEDDSGATQRITILFVLKKQGDDWKIASVRILAP